jgi:surfeit locus 1 family protein
MAMTPRLWAWIAAAAGIALTVALGNWQTRRAEQKLALQAQWDAMQAAAPRPLNAVTAAGIALQLPARVQLQGEWLGAQSVWLDNRQLDGRAGLWLVTPLKTADGALVPVLRGWAARDPADRAKLPPLPAVAGAVSIEGTALAQVPRLLELGGAWQDGPLPAVWQNLDLAAYERVSGMAVLPLVVQQTSAADDGLIRRWPPPATGVERHRGYAFQWYALAVTIALLALVLEWRRRRACLKDSRGS